LALVWYWMTKIRFQPLRTTVAVECKWVIKLKLGRTRWWTANLMKAAG
jgi:hypothetical protein